MCSFLSVCVYLYVGSKCYFRKNSIPVQCYMVLLLTVVLTSNNYLYELFYCWVLGSSKKWIVKWEQFLWQCISLQEKFRNILWNDWRMRLLEIRGTTKNHKIRVKAKDPPDEGL